MDHGTEVTVSCDGPDLELRGDDVITCDQDTSFKFNDKPKCNPVGVCTELPASLNLVTGTTFPINKGTLMYVGCGTGHSFVSGSRAITCEQDDQFIVDDGQTLPLCQIG